ncbi:MAG TPA: leucine--tRNA ligase [Dehalococcoidia bacterium]|nr:leucine--tRNA ligase [Dehalococcoidia bacterium]
MDATKTRPGGAERYDPQAIERKWQARWEADQLYRTPDDDPRPKWYALTMLPYTSGDLHIGHWFAMSPSDAAARYKRMTGYNVLFPMGFDAFGLPAENAAIKNGAHPAAWTAANVEHMRGQLKMMGAMFDWSREVVTASPDYYRWTQWWFLQLLKHDLAYKKKASVWWCPKDQTVLANEQVLDGKCERCDTVVAKRDLEQWFFRITKYADDLLDFSELRWTDQVASMQRNWIGRSEGAHLAFGLDVPGVDTKEITVFTTRPDTVFGVSFFVLAPEHPLVEQITTPEQRAAVQAYVDAARKESEIERLSTEHEKTGVFTGAYVTNKFDGRKVPVWIADYVLATYGTGAVMGVPGHDQRDFDFAKKYGLPIIPVFQHPDWDGGELTAALPHGGTMINSGPLDGTPDEAAVATAIKYAEEQGYGKGAVTYRLRDWLISRQRMWGTPIPIIYCDDHGAVPVPEKDLPVLLPDDAEFRPTGESPLTYHQGFLNTTCPTCGKPAKRETDTMDTFMCSSWYQMRYIDPHNDERPFSRELARKWLPVDQYTGGAEHAVMHLLYTRFFTKAAHDMGIVEHSEPMVRLFNQGQILGPDGQRMSKSRGNVVAPDSQVERWGADTFRAYLMFLGPWDQGGPYDASGITGIYRWLNRAWNAVTGDIRTAAKPDAPETRGLRRWTHKTIKKVTEDIQEFRFNTMIAAMMEFTNELIRLRESGLHGDSSSTEVDGDAWREAVESLTLLLAPPTPHIAEELWQRLGKPYSIHTQPWPRYDEALARADEVEVAVQVNGKVRDRLLLPLDAPEDVARARALESASVSAHVAGKEIARVIYVPNRLLNIVVK